MSDKFYNKLRLKKLNRTSRKLVFRSKTGELELMREKDINNQVWWPTDTQEDINIDQIFYADGVF